MQFQLDLGRPMTKQLQTLSWIVRDLKTVGQKVYEEEQALNVIRAILNTKIWQNFLQVIAHFFWSTSK